MEDASGSGRGPSLSMPSSQASTARKEWRVVPEHPARSAGDEEYDRSKLGHSHERTIYEVQQGQELHDAMNFCSIQIDGIGGLDDDSDKKLQYLANKRDELQQMEIQLRAHMMARSAIVEMKNSFDSQMKEQAAVIAELQEQLDEREQRIMELQSKMEETERELHAIRLDNEAAWAKEDLLREQNKEIANFRRERDSVEAERAHRVKQIHDLQEHIQEKDRQVMELQEQHRIAQETVLFKEDRLREAQTWIARVQEMDALQSTTLQAELRERTEQYNQLWLGCQRQFMEMERLHMQTVQQLQLELSEAREKKGTYGDESHVSIAKSSDMPQHEQTNGNHLEANESGSSSANSASASHGNSENTHSIASSGNASAQANHVHGVPVAPPSLLGVASYPPPGQVTVHPYVMHQQVATHSVPASVSQSYVGHFPSAAAISSYQHWQGQQAVADGLQGSLSPSEAENNLNQPGSKFSYETSVNGHDIHTDHLNVHPIQGMEANSAKSPIEVVHVHESVEKDYLTSQSQANLQQISSQFHEALGLTSVGQTAATKENDAIGSSNEKLESTVVTTESSDSSQSSLPSETVINPLNPAEINNTAHSVLPEVLDSVAQTNIVPPKGTPGTALLDERSLLACVARTIPAGGKIRISSTLPNRLGKMLAPLHWHDYRKKYGKLDEFMASHPELFLIEGDYIQLREGAQGIIAATAAVAKVAAAAAATSPYSSLFPSVAVTPMAQANRLKKIPSVELHSVSNGDVKVSSISGPSQTGHSSVLQLGENGSSSDRKLNARSGANIINKQQSRRTSTLDKAKFKRSSFSGGIIGCFAPRLDPFRVL
ncbi:hypothetical protein V2J09_001920 [Rumex salicifolius]